MSEQEELLKELFGLVEKDQGSSAEIFLNKHFKKNSVDFEILENYLYSRCEHIIEFILKNMDAFINKKSADHNYLAYKVENSRDHKIKEFYKKSMLINAS